MKKKPIFVAMKAIESISVFDMLKIGVGPSSSHTLGPWRAALRWMEKLQRRGLLEEVSAVSIHLYGSLSLTGKGHATDIAVMMGLLGTDPVTFPIEEITSAIEGIERQQSIALMGHHKVAFIPSEHIKFHRRFLDFHPNGITFKAVLNNGKSISDTYYSIGGGFVVQKERKRSARKQEQFAHFPFPVQKG